jgi:predicted permease
MSASFAADALVLLHAAFIVFAVFGGLLLFHRRAWMWVHLPAATWAATVVIMGWICPLTPWEQSLRATAGQQGYTGGFIEHYVLTAIYPEGLTRGVQIALGIGVIVFNLAVYAWALRRRKPRGPGSGTTPRPDTG